MPDALPDLPRPVAASTPCGTLPRPVLDLLQRTHPAGWQQGGAPAEAIELLLALRPALPRALARQAIAEAVAALGAPHEEGHSR